MLLMHRFMGTDMGQGAVVAYGLDNPQLDDVDDIAQRLMGLVRYPYLGFTVKIINDTSWTRRRGKDILVYLSITTARSSRIE